MGRREQRGGPKPFSEQLGLFYSAPLSLIPLLVILSLSFAQAFFASASILALVAVFVAPVLSLRYGLHLLLRFARGVFDLGAVVGDEERKPYVVYKVIAALVLVGSVFAFFAGIFLPLAWVFGGLFVVCAPAIVMLITLNDSFSAGLNVGKWLHLVSVVGGSYGWLLAMSFLVVMGSGMVNGVLGSLLGTGFVVRLLAAVVSNYALYVVFCMMGYVLYEKADHFGIETHDARRERLIPGNSRVSSAQELLAQGDVEGALELAADEARNETTDAKVQERYFKLLQMRGDESRLLPQATRWLRACAHSKRSEDCARIVKQWWVANPTMLDDMPQVILDVAPLAAQAGAPHEALKMLQHFQKTQRGAMIMPRAFLLESEILFSRLREPQLAKARLQELIRVFPNSQAELLEANAMLKMIEAAEQRPMPKAVLPKQP